MSKENRIKAMKDLAQQYAMDVAWYAQLLELAKQPTAATPTCTCDIHLLMRSGCQCGGFAAERAGKGEGQS